MAKPTDEKKFVDLSDEWEIRIGISQSDDLIFMDYERSFYVSGIENIYKLKKFLNECFPEETK